jgi:dipeptidyl aminopeptidase/acylaminoacyl peptidase
MLLPPAGARRVFVSLLLCASFTLFARPQGAPSVPTASHVSEILSSLHRGRSIAQVGLSPDGKRLAWSQEGEFHVAPIGDLSQSQPVTAAAQGESCRESDLTWSPASNAVAFLSDCADLGGQSDLYISSLDGSPAHRLTALHGDVNQPAFSPDGKRIAFLYVEGATRPAGALAAQDLPSGVIGADNADIQRVAQVTVPSPLDCEPPAAAANRPLGSRTPCLLSLFSFLTPPNLHVYEFDWSPDSNSLAYIAADPPGENNWWVARLYTQQIGDPPAAILNPTEASGPLHGLQIAVPRWSPDGKWIAFIGGLMSDQGVTGGDVYVIPVAGAHRPINLTEGRHESAAWISWAIPGQIDYSAMAGGFSQLRTVALDSPSSPPARNNVVKFQFPAQIGDGRMELSLSYARGQWAFVKSSFSQPPEIWYARDVAAECSPPADDPNGCYEFRQLSHFNEGVKPAGGEAVSLTWTNDGFHIQGWLLPPANYDPAKKYPMVVEIHGGPASSVLSRWNGGAGGFSATVFSELGYFVLMPNPRGSFGQGEAFVQANRKDFGYGDLRDILAGVDTALSKYPVDPHRIGIAGWSYGGFMTMFAVTQTHRFRAAVAGAGISDWLSYYGENSIDQWMIPYFGASVYDDPAVYAKSSAINFIKNASTPTLAVVGDRDGECPAPQSFEFWHALRDLHIPTELVVYPNEGHGLSDPAHRRDVLQRAVDWFAQYMPPGP